MRRRLPGLRRRLLARGFFREPPQRLFGSVELAFICMVSTGMHSMPFGARARRDVEGALVDERYCTATVLRSIGYLLFEFGRTLSHACPSWPLLGRFRFRVDVVGVGPESDSFAPTSFDEVHSSSGAAATVDGQDWRSWKIAQCPS